MDLATGLRVTLAVEDAVARLRAVAGTTELEAVHKTLGARSGRRDGSWTRRIKEDRAKLLAGRATDLAELARDGVRASAPTGDAFSHRERRVYRQARRLLVSELCSALPVASTKRQPKPGSTRRSRTAADPETAEPDQSGAGTAAGLDGACGVNGRSSSSPAWMTP